MASDSEELLRPFLRKTAFDLIERHGFLFTPPITKIDERHAIQFGLDEKKIDLARSGKLYFAPLNRNDIPGGILYFFDDQKTYDYFLSLHKRAGSEISALVFLSINYRKEENTPHLDFTNMCDIISRYLPAEVSISPNYDNFLEIKIRKVIEFFSNRELLLEKIDDICLALSLVYRCGMKISYSYFSEYHKAGENVRGDFIFEILPDRQKIKIISQNELVDIIGSLHVSRSKYIAKGLQNFYDQRSSIARIAVGWAAVESLILQDLRPEHILDSKEIDAVQRTLEEHLDIDQTKKTLLIGALRDPNRMRRTTRNSTLATRISSLLGLEHDSVLTELRGLHKVRGKVVHCIFDDSAELLLPTENFIEKILTELYFAESNKKINHVR